MSLGIQSALLLVGMVQGLVFALLLVRLRRNGSANRLLATLLLLFVLTLAPSMIGFAGAYSKYPWLTFAPFEVTLGFGPLLWLYVHRLLRGRLPRTWYLHLVPVLIQFLYYTVVFLRPLEWRYQFNGAVHLPWVIPFEAAASLTSVLVYWTAAFRLYRRYRAWAPQFVSDSENYSLEWLRNFLLASAGGFALWAGFVLVDQTGEGLSYAAFFWLDLAAAVLLYGFAVAGYRHADLSWPAMPGREDLTPGGEPELQDEDLEPSAWVEPPPQAEGRSAEEWALLADKIQSRVLEEGWYLEPDLTLETLSRRLATNSWTLSRAINEGLGRNFNDFINTLRVEAVRTHLSDPGEERSLLEIALSCGFNSKTSFNRSFKKIAGETPSQCRTRLHRRPRS